MPTLSTREDLKLTFRFYVEITGMEVGYFTDCEGLIIEREVFEIKEGGVNQYVHQFAGRLKHQRVKLTRGSTGDFELYQWFLTGRYDGTVARKTITINMYNVGAIGDRQLAQIWTVFDAFPVKYEGPMLKVAGGKTDAAVESVEFVHQGLTVEYLDADSQPIFAPQV